MYFHPEDEQHHQLIVLSHHYLGILQTDHLAQTVLLQLLQQGVLLALHRVKVHGHELPYSNPLQVGPAEFGREE